MTQLEAEIWIQNMENHFGNNLISRKYEVAHALQYFTQVTAIWWKMHHAIQGFSAAQTWDEFKKTLLRSHLIQKCYDNLKKKTCACKIYGEIGHTEEEHKDGCTHCEENHLAKECPTSQLDIEAANVEARKRHLDIEATNAATKAKEVALAIMSVDLTKMSEKTRSWFEARQKEMFDAEDLN
ncbi:Serine/threonine-protein kinase mph1 [Hordeum vulgare]|nr:Serine/threonine-protein kinase mph1 [Hordeum vulgare]